MSSFIHLGPQGLNPDQLSEFIQPTDLGRAKGRYIQILVENNEGRAALRSIEIKATKGAKNKRRKEAKPSR